MTTQLAKAVFSSGEIPADWRVSFIPILYKDKSEALDSANYRGLKLTDQIMKLPERTLDFSSYKMVNIDEMQSDFVPCREDAIFFFVDEWVMRGIQWAVWGPMVSTVRS